MQTHLLNFKRAARSIVYLGIYSGISVTPNTITPPSPTPDTSRTSIGPLSSMIRDTLTPQQTINLITFFQVQCTRQLHRSPSSHMDTGSSSLRSFHVHVNHRHQVLSLFVYLMIYIFKQSTTVLLIYRGQAVVCPESMYQALSSSNQLVTSFFTHRFQSSASIYGRTYYLKQGTMW